MGIQDLATYSLIVPAIVFGLIAWRARKQGRTTFGLGLRDGAWREALLGLLLGVAGMAVLFGVLLLTRQVTTTGAHTPFTVGPLLGIAAYFLVLFVVEEIVFHALFMTGLGVVAGRTVAWIVVAVLVALPYALSPHATVLAVVGSVFIKLVDGFARWRTGRIWAAVGLRLGWNVTMIAFGFPDSGDRLAVPLLDLQVPGTPVLTGGDFGPEAGLVGMAVCAVLVLVLTRWPTGARGPWTVRPREDGRRFPTAPDGVRPSA